jgi:hypothetical protein
MRNRLENAARRRNANERDRARSPSLVADPGSAIPDDGLCGQCGRKDSIEEEDTSGSSLHWFVCNHCGYRWGRSGRSIPPSRGRRERVKEERLSLK